MGGLVFVCVTRQKLFVSDEKALLTDIFVQPKSFVAGIIILHVPVFKHQYRKSGSVNFKV